MGGLPAYQNQLTEVISHYVFLFPYTLSRRRELHASQADIGSNSSKTPLVKRESSPETVLAAAAALCERHAFALEQRVVQAAADLQRYPPAEQTRRPPTPSLPPVTIAQEQNKYTTLQLNIATTPEPKSSQLFDARLRAIHSRLLIAKLQFLHCQSCS